MEFIDTAGAGYDEELEPDGESRLNRQEAEAASLARCGSCSMPASPRGTSR